MPHHVCSINASLCTSLVKFVPAANTAWTSGTGAVRLFGERLALPNFSVVYHAVIKKSGLNKSCRVLCADLIPCQPMTTVSVSFLDH